MFFTDVSNLGYYSKKLVKIQCEFNTSNKCKQIVEQEYRAIIKNINNNQGKYRCLFCAHSKYNFDLNFFKNIDSEEKAYLLGWIASDGYIGKKFIRIKIHKKDIKILEKLRDIICKEIPIKIKNEKYVQFVVNSVNICKDLCKWLKLEFKKNLI